MGIFGGEKIRKEFIERWIKAGENVDIPTLIVHGSEDKEVEIQLAEELSKSIKSSKLTVINGADHKFSKRKILRSQ